MTKGGSMSWVPDGALARMKAFIPGSGGFLGRHIAEEFRRAGYEVSGVDIALAESVSFRQGETYRRMELPDQSIEDLLHEIAPDFCVHCAGGASVASSICDPAADFKSSVVVTQQLLAALRKIGPAVPGNFSLERGCLRPACEASGQRGCSNEPNLALRLPQKNLRTALRASGADQRPADSFPPHFFSLRSRARTPSALGDGRPTCQGKAA